MASRSRLPPRIAIMVAATLAAVSSGLRAQTTSDPIAARALFDEGRALAAKGNYEQACPKFEESQRLDAGIGTLFNWADCLEHTGKTASAWVRYLEVAAAAKANGQLERERVARDRASALEPKLSRLTIEVKSNNSGLEVFRDQIAIGKALWGASVPIDPGKHVLEARAPNKKRWVLAIDVPVGSGRVSVMVPPLDDDSPQPPSPETDTSGTTTTSGGPTASGVGTASEVPPGGSLAASPLNAEAAQDTVAGLRKGESSRTDGTGSSGGALSLQKGAGIGVGLVGIGALALGGWLYAKAKTKNDNALLVCEETVDACPEEDIAYHDGLLEEGKQAQTWSTVSFIVGGAAIVGGVLLYATAPGAPDRNSMRTYSAAGSSRTAMSSFKEPHAGPSLAGVSVQLQPLAGPSLAGMILRGVW